ncbi:hypothetical protein [Psychroflexus sp. ALD_RP9]|uniref:hypothetical protein n=1 Tax=Psychroflexus sp. ALD_RP9 TaxID=2777186 RepID=UPI001A8DBAA5|nr:hypothetical protein [Psychroflexus sp. ALD_RP9]QSS97487.1 hypothetical protein IMZ30_01880 [Psychroflexus sp. ALD_RP9]
MKKILSILLISLIVIACEGDIGPPGPPGPPGLNGVNILGNVYEIEVNFTPSNDFSIISEFPNTIEVFESDVVMVYLLEEQVNDPTGPVDVWAQLPQTFYLNNGDEVVYNFNHTFFDTNIFLDGNAAFNLLPPEFTQNQVFRIAILPAEFAEAYDVSTFKKLNQALKQENINLNLISLN